MHTKPILNSSEARVDTILRYRLGKQGYRIFPKVRLSDALEKEASDRLTDREFGYFTKAHLDFLVTQGGMPAFAVEFDGPAHLDGAKAVGHDVLKNGLCRSGDLPLLRVGSSEVERDELDELSVLDYMLMRYVAWREEYPAIMRELEEYAATIGPECDPDSLAIDLDPSFHFDLRHPFPGRDAVLERLWSKYRVAWSSVSLGGDEQFHTCNRRALVWRPGEKEQPAVFSQDVSASLRSWLPLRTEVPSPDMFHLTPNRIQGAAASPSPNEILEQFRIRVESMWFPRLPGLSAWDITEHYAEYLGFRAVEQWAGQPFEGDG
ncbi:MAG: DUF2726 domain-containing protein [Candidatus Bipolaricaulota bacterium]|nr:DUF2726 domain-containing protein [Candidatus Bipolaricaulota bacterium]